ncbi:MAG: putative membrane protein, partial [Bacteroidia bacterium]
MGKKPSIILTMQLQQKTMAIMLMILATLFTSQSHAKITPSSSLDSVANSELMAVIFGHPPRFIDRSKQAEVLVVFPSTYQSCTPFQFFSGDDSLVLNTADPVRISLPIKGELELKIKPTSANQPKIPGPSKMKIKVLKKEPLITKDSIVFGVLMLCLALVFLTSTSKNKIFKKFYAVVPALLMCYLLPSLLASMGVVNESISNTYSIAKDYLLPSALILMTLSIDFKGIARLGSKSIVMFLTGTLGIIIGGPIAILIVSTFSPETVGGNGPDAIWRGMTTIAGSWIGGGANQTAMLEAFKYTQTKYGAMVLVDIVVANIWMAILLYGVGKKAKIDRWLKADSSAIDELQDKMEKFTLSIAKNPTLSELMLVLGTAFFATAMSHAIGGYFTDIFSSMPGWKDSVLASGFFWVVVLATTFGLL